MVSQNEEEKIMNARRCNVFSSCLGAVAVASAKIVKHVTTRVLTHEVQDNNREFFLKVVSKVCRYVCCMCSVYHIIVVADRLKTIPH